LPQGVDQILRQSGGSIGRPMVGLVAQSVLETPEGRHQYEERMGQLLTSVFKIEVITNRLHQIAAKIETVLAETDPAAALAHEQAVLQFCRRFQQRANNLKRQLSPEGDMVSFDRSGVVPLADWQPHIDLGSPNLSREKVPGGGTRLLISAQES